MIYLDFYFGEGSYDDFSNVYTRGRHVFRRVYIVVQQRIATNRTQHLCHLSKASVVKLVYKDD